MPNPIAFSIFGIDIRWYGVLIATGMILAAVITYVRAPRHGIERGKHPRYSADINTSGNNRR